MLTHLTSRSTSHSHRRRPDSRPRPLHIPGQASHVQSLIAFFNRKSQEPVVVSRPCFDRSKIPPNKVRSMVQSWLRVASSAPSPSEGSSGGGGVVVTRTSHTSPITLRGAMEFPPQEVDARLRSVKGWKSGRAVRTEEARPARRKRREGERRGGDEAGYGGTPEVEIAMPLSPPEQPAMTPPVPMPEVVQPLTALRLRRLESEITRSSSLGVEVSASPSGSEMPRTPGRGGRERYGEPGEKRYIEPEEERYIEPEGKRNDPRMAHAGRMSPASRALSVISKRSTRSSWKDAFQSVRDSFRRRPPAAGSSGVTGSSAVTGSSVSVAGSPARTGSSASKLSAEMKPGRDSRSKYIKSIPDTPSPDPPAAGYITAPDTFGASKNLMAAVQTHVTRRSLMEQPAASEENLLPSDPGQQQNGAAVNISRASHAPPTDPPPLSQSVEEPNTLTAVGELSRWNKSPRSARPRAYTKRTTERRAIPDSFRRPHSPTRTRTRTTRKESPLKPVSPLRVIKDKSAQSTITPATITATAGPRNVTFTTAPDPDPARLTRASMDTLTSFELQPPASLSSSSDILREPPPQGPLGRKAAPANMRFESLSSLDTPPPNPPQAIRSPTLIREMAGEGKGKGWKVKRGKTAAATTTAAAAAAGVKSLPGEKGERGENAAPPKRALIDLQGMQMQFNDGQGGSPASASDVQESPQESESSPQESERSPQESERSPQESERSPQESGSGSSPQEPAPRRDSMSLSLSYIMPVPDEGGSVEAFRDLEMGLPVSTPVLGDGDPVLVGWGGGYGVRPLGIVTAVGGVVTAVEEPVARGRRRKRVAS
ncbi:uncharacterized protein H6S33_009416 [Morchella sextelata]|uniref:uncharacterized protein n=1 Tax=Morchella sextelata TaxID=1174677 RepID=UPI001D054C4B|nr:uncharacterized protein H6S33_009416 [Morchella sextelata]KAH0613036.1 hypothetical protein H6S33_009416 [Morchella sextelata]